MSVAIIRPIYSYPHFLPVALHYAAIVFLIETIAELDDPSGKNDNCETLLLLDLYLEETCDVRRPEDHHLQSWLEQRHRSALHSPAQLMIEQQIV